MGQRDRVLVSEGPQWLDIREPCTQLRDEIWNLVKVAFDPLAGDHGLDGSLTAPQIGAAQGANS